MLDALAVWSFPADKVAVALNGLGTELQFQQLRDLPCRKLILATDMDEAGLKARKRIRTNVKNKLVTEYIWDVHVAKDINDMTPEYFNQLEEVF
jgi:5S rRNA maturation endonuclease (ribonuclease M5)